MKSKILVTNIRTSNIINESCNNIKNQSLILTESRRNPLTNAEKANFIKIVLEDVLKTPVKAFNVKHKKRR